jgi:transcriptional regulator with XRE-family HTH domain
MNQNQVIGANIKHFRTRLEIKQEDIAKVLGIPREEISYYENGKRNIPTSIISRIADIFGVDEYDIYEIDLENQSANIAFAFRADNLESEDLKEIANFRKIVRNYLNMKKVFENEHSNS